jgi:adenosine kinase
MVLIRDSQIFCYFAPKAKYSNFKYIGRKFIMTVLVCGSFAYDNIMVFNDRFKNHILPDKVHMLNVSFLVPELRREFGGCAGNIAYNLNLLGGDVKPVGTIGEDFTPYAKWMDQCGVSRELLKTIDNTFTAQAYITTDLDDNQITAFHPGAMNEAHTNPITATDNVQMGIISPDGRQGMIDHSTQFAEANIPFIFDPGQGMPMFDGDDLLKFIDQATWLTLNDYESQLMQEKTGLTLEKIAERVEAVIVTLGGEGSKIYTASKVIEIEVAKARKINDPTGCGDAYRGGLMYGMTNKLDWETSGRIAALLGSMKIEHHGTQNHKITLDEFKDYFKEVYGYSFS